MRTSKELGVIYILGVLLLTSRHVNACQFCICQVERIQQIIVKILVKCLF